MFGLFKKPDTRESTDRSLSYLNALPETTRTEITDSIEAFLMGVFSKQIPDGFKYAMAAKQYVMQEHQLEDYRHPAFSMYQLLEDAFLAKTAHEKLASGPYSAERLCRFVMANSKDPKTGETMLCAAGFQRFI